MAANGHHIINCLMCISRLSARLIDDIDSFCRTHWKLTKRADLFFEMTWPTVARLYGRSIKTVEGLRHCYDFVPQNVMKLCGMKCGSIVHAVKEDVRWRDISGKLPERMCQQQKPIKDFIHGIDIASFNLALAAKCGDRKLTVLEIGAYAGDLTAKLLSLPNIAKVYAVDPWDPNIDKKNDDVCIKSYG